MSRDDEVRRARPGGASGGARGQHTVDGAALMERALTLPALLEERLATQPDGIALVDGERRITYAELDALSRSTAAWLRAQGIGPGDRVAVWLTNRVEWLALLFGLARLRAVLLAVNTRYRAAELEYLLERSGPRMLVMQAGFRSIDFRSILKGARPESAGALERVAIVGAEAGALSPILGKPG